MEAKILTPIYELELSDGISLKIHKSIKRYTKYYFIFALSIFLFQ